ncbi:Gfo/Idh/MocA family oxidoreductase [Candidatus Pacearchaeota archaeon]|nr:Gfo/Idh/MocA family oxidoreductase [Candidatus Pacearchaeota archaeon]
MEKVVIVGTGDYYYRFLAPCLKVMQENDLVDVVRTIDIREKPFPNKDLFKSVEHKLREPSQNLSELVLDLKEQNPVVILGHANNLHTPDAKELVSHGFRVMIEKPYVVNKLQLKELSNLIKENPNHVALLEYHLMRKTIPLLMLDGLVKPDSFYFKSENILRQKDFLEDSNDSMPDIKSLIGKPLSVQIKILEAGSDIGKLDHRGSHLFDKKTGGGMIQDLGFHAVIPLFALKDYLGDIDKSFNHGSVRIARCKEYFDLGVNLHKLPKEQIAESYAEFSFLTSKKIPVQVLVGKYISDRENQRRIKITGTKGSLYLDYHQNVLYFSDNDEKRKDILELTNQKQIRYVPVIKTALEHLNNKNPFTIDYTSSLLDAQEFILNVVSKAGDLDFIHIHDTGEHASDVFSGQKGGSVGLENTL